MKLSEFEKRNIDQVKRIIGQLVVALCIGGLSFTASRTSWTFVHSSHFLAWTFVILGIGLAVAALVAGVHTTINEVYPFVRKLLKEK